MIEALSEMFWPLMACFVLVGIHAYLGIHVIARKVIFVDLALAQIAGLGAVYGVFIGLSLDTDTFFIKGISILFTLVGALLFAFTRTNDEKIPHEAIIGIIYAATLSMTVLVTTNLPHGADEVQQMLAGNILWVTKNEVLFTACLYLVVGIIHFIFRRQFFLLSEEIAHKQNVSINIKLWDFLFYATFGVVVTSSVGMGGVLLVFGFLVIPSVMGVLLAQKTKWRLIIGWSSGALMSIIGVIASYFLDLPSGPTIVVMLAFFLFVIVLVQELLNKITRRQGFFHVAVVLFLFLAVLLMPLLTNLAFDHEAQKSRRHLLTHGGSEIEVVKTALLSGNDDEVEQALASIRTNWLHELLPHVLPILSSSNDKKRELAVQTLGSLGDARIKAPMIEAIKKEKDVFIKIEMAEALLAVGEKYGLSVLASIMTTSNSEFAKDDALKHLTQHIIDAPMNAQQLARWLNDNFARLRFDESKHKFYSVGRE